MIQAEHRINTFSALEDLTRQNYDRCPSLKLQNSTHQIYYSLIELVQDTKVATIFDINYIVTSKDSKNIPLTQDIYTVLIEKISKEYWEKMRNYIDARISELKTGSSPNNIIDRFFEIAWDINFMAKEVVVITDDLWQKYMMISQDKNL